MAQPPLTSRQLQAKATKEKIFDTATEMIKKYGYDNVTIEDICSQCNIAKGLFYHYFKSKIGITAASEELMANKFCEEAQKITTGDISFRIRDICQKMFMTAENIGVEITRRRSIQLFSGEKPPNDLEGKETLLTAHCKQFMQTMLEEAINNGELKPETPVTQILEMFSIFFNGLLCRWGMINGKESLVNMSEQIISWLIQVLICPYLINSQTAKIPENTLNTL